MKIGPDGCFVCECNPAPLECAVSKWEFIFCLECVSLWFHCRDKISGVPTHLFRHFQTIDCDSDSVCKLAELTACPGCVSGPCTCTTSLEAMCVPRYPRKCNGQGDSRTTKRKRDTSCFTDVGCLLQAIVQRFNVPTTVSLVTQWIHKDVGLAAATLHRRLVSISSIFSVCSVQVTVAEVSLFLRTRPSLCFLIAACPPRTCRVNCPFGYATGPNGCETCRCKHPCDVSDSGGFRRQVPNACILCSGGTGNSKSGTAVCAVRRLHERSDEPTDGTT